MNNELVKKVIMLAVVVLIAIPIVPHLIPKPITFERIKGAFEAANLPVQEYMEAPQPGLEAAAEASMMIGSVRVNIYQFDDVGVQARQFEYQKKDPGQAIVETWGLAQSLGAAVPKQTPSLAAQRRSFMIVATGEDKALLNRIIEVFKSF